MKTAASPAKTATLVWLGLTLATILTLWLSENELRAPRIAVTGAVLIAAVKVRLVFLYFMELRQAPWGLRLIFEVWVVACTTAILVGYWLGVS